MANKIKQFRYYNDTTNIGKNSPSTITVDGVETNVSYSHYVSGAVFGDCFPVLQFGIQSLPGTKFYLNNGNDPIIIGTTGIYELDLEGQTEITRIQVDGSSMKTINDNDNAYLIIDIIYDNGEE